MAHWTKVAVVCALGLVVIFFFLIQSDTSLDHDHIARPRFVESDLRSTLRAAVSSLRNANGGSASRATRGTTAAVSDKPLAPTDLQGLSEQHLPSVPEERNPPTPTAVSTPLPPLPAECEKLVGVSWLDKFAISQELVCSPKAPGGSRIARWVNEYGSRIYWMDNVVVDFGRMDRRGDQRSFRQGFVRATACDPSATLFPLGDVETSIGALDVSAGAPPLSTQTDCDMTISRPTVVVQHDDVGNVYHFTADYWRTWAGVAVFQRSFCSKARALLLSTLPVWPGGEGVDPDAAHCDAVQLDGLQLLNMDSRLQCNTVGVNGEPLAAPIEDCVTPLFSFHRAIFGAGVVRAQDLAGKRVCFTGGLSWATHMKENQIWRGFHELTGCDYPSQLIQAFASSTLTRSGAIRHVPTACYPQDSACAPVIRIVYVARKRKPFSSSPVVRRTVGNEAEFLVMLKDTARRIREASVSLPQADRSTLRTSDLSVDVVDADFVTMSIEEQVRTMRSAHLVIGMHGAGLALVLYMASTDACGGRTSLIEMLPPDHATIFGIQHLTAYAGVTYKRWLETGRTTGQEFPTTVDLQTVSRMVDESVVLNLQTRVAQCAQ